MYNNGQNLRVCSSIIFYIFHILVLSFQADGKMVYQYCEVRYRGFYSTVEPELKNTIVHFLCTSYELMCAFIFANAKKQVFS